MSREELLKKYKDNGTEFIELCKEIIEFRKGAKFNAEYPDRYHICRLKLEDNKKQSDILYEKIKQTFAGHID